MKNWLIRTTNNVILGPVSEQKLKLLIKKGSLEPSDEICSGNGYWIYIRERRLIERYLYQGVDQGFNPIYHESEDYQSEEELEDTLEMETLSENGDSDPTLDIDSSSTMATEKTKVSDRKREMSKEKVKGKAPLFSGLALKLTVVLFAIIALFLLYFRNMILLQLFS